MNKKSGVLGVSGVSSDLRDLSAAADEGNKRAELALKMFAYSVKKLIGAYAAAMGGVDAIVFTGGIGENNPRLRSKVAKKLEFLGLTVDEEINARAKVTSDENDITTSDSKVKILVIPTNEELMIARDTLELVQ